MDHNHLNGDLSNSSIPKSRDARIGVLTKTVIPSPVVKWIVHCRLRSTRFNDVVFVGDDFIEVKQVKDGGRLEHIASKRDFDARIRAAKTFVVQPDVPDEILFIKREYDDTNTDDEEIPPQVLVLTLDSQNLLFIAIVADSFAGYRFVHQTFPIPIFDRTLFQPGEHLAVDPHSRALAVAANEREVVIYNAKSYGKEILDPRNNQCNWCPISAQRMLQVEGAIQHVDFLLPPSEDQDHIILLLIVADQRRIKAIWIDWSRGSDLYDAQIHPGQPLETIKSVPTMLIPLRNADFLLGSGTEIKRWSDILCGSETCSVVSLVDVAPENPVALPRQPVWINWCRPRRTKAGNSDKDSLYIAREDGTIIYLHVADDIQSCHAGNIGCHVGTAFASLGDDKNPDILAAAGDMSGGSVATIGNWFNSTAYFDRSRRETMNMEEVQKVSNWASVTDMLTSSLPGKSTRSRDSVFVTSCRQPYGTVTELRHGVEARVACIFPLDSLKGVTNLWTLPLSALGQILFIFSNPLETRLLGADAEIAEIEEFDGSDLALDCNHPTLAASATPNGKIIQVTARGIRVSPGTSPNFEDVARFDFSEDNTTIAAAIAADGGLLTTAQRLSSGSSLVCHRLFADDPAFSGRTQIGDGVAYELASEPLCLTSFSQDGESTILTATVDGRLIAISVNIDGTLDRRCETELLPDGDPSLCDSMCVLRSTKQNSHGGNAYLIVCGLRDGRIYNQTVYVTDKWYLGETSTISFSQTAVKIMQPAGEHLLAYAMGGTDFCLLSWDGQSAESMSIQSIWMSDKDTPSMGQDAVSGCTHLPAAHLLSSSTLGGSLVVVSEDQCFIANLDRKPTCVPRQISVTGTPNRLIYSEQNRSLVCASLRNEIRAFPSALPHSKPDMRRQIWPALDFIPSRGNEPSCTYNMQPGERVYALLEWGVRTADGRKYSFILVGGSYLKSDGSTRGRITFLQPSHQNWMVVDLKEQRRESFHAPVYAMALFDDMTYVASVGRTLIVARFSVEQKSWKQLCAPHSLPSAGIHISVSRPWLYVSTAEDSLVILELAEDASKAGANYEYVLRPASAAPRADILLNHCPLNTDGAECVLVSTKLGQVIGIQPTHHHQSHMSSSKLLFEAQLPRSLTRIRQGNIRPPWKAGPPAGVLQSNIVGCAADGTLVGLALLDESLWRRLGWLQRLCEWSTVLSPHSSANPAYSVSEHSYVRHERAMPIGLGKDSAGDILMRTSRSRLNDGHIDGDVLHRLSERGGADMLRQILHQTALRDDRVGEWMARHLDRELEAVDETIEAVRRVLDGWL